MVNFNTTSRETKLIHRIAKRMIEIQTELATDCKWHFDALSLCMDITACHCNGNPLKLQELWNAGRGDFLHDVCGIVGNLDRKTGKLCNCFSPRYSA